ncbi:HPP family protein [Haloplanus natans]|uniref:HPP family protein n=1 Tax=Haloplanus natans TaxID=376171 RepID=UPI0006778CE7|nr:HPP family protein [Haloplanus natans]
MSDFHRWLEETQNFIHVSLFLFIPLLIGLVTYISNTVDLLPFLLFPPLASGTHTLFAHPESKYASPRRFVGGMTAGAVCGWIALEVAARYWYHVPPETFHVHPGAAAFGVLLTSAVTWLADLEESQAFSTALLVLVPGVTQVVYVVSVFVSSTLVAGVFTLWRRTAYERRADYLYQTTRGDDNVLVPMRGETAEAVAAFGARLASAHETGKIVLLDVVATELDGETVVAAEDGNNVRLEEPTTASPEELPASVQETVDRLQSRAGELSERFDVPCEIVVTGEPNDAQLAIQTAHDMHCDLIVAPYESNSGRLSRFVRELFASRLDVVAVRTDGSRNKWRRILAPVKYPGDVAHAILDFADRLASDDGRVAVCHCIDSERERRDAEEMVANLAETFEGAFETRVTKVPITEFLSSNAANYDLTVVGSSSERTRVSRFIDPPTFQELDDIDCDVAIVHRG